MMLAQLVSTSPPSGVTRPRPVTTTRRMPLLLVRHPGDAPGSLRCNAPPAIAGGASMDKQKRPPAPETGREPSIERPSLKRSEEHTSELQSLMRISYAVFCLNKKNNN